MCDARVLFWLQMACLYEENLARFDLVLQMGHNLSHRLYPHLLGRLDWSRWLEVNPAEIDDRLEPPEIIMASYAAMLYMVICFERSAAAQRLIAAKRVWNVFARGHYQGRFDLANRKLPHNETVIMLAIRHNVVDVFD
jgi:hypothetical protein